MSTDTVHAFACYQQKEDLREFEYPAVSLAENPTFVDIDITHCGCCHSDLHTVRGDWGPMRAPLVPGHEIVGVVRAVGSAVTKYKPGDRVGVGCMVDSCGTCKYCTSGFEQHCPNCVFTYGSVDKSTKDRITYGGYASRIQVKERFVFSMNYDMSPAEMAPLLCAGVTTYAPLVQYGVKAGDRVAVVGLGGLGHLAVQYAAAMGCEVTVISTSANKWELAQKLGAKAIMSLSNKDDVEKYQRHFDFILNTVSAVIDIETLVGTLDVSGKLCFVGVPEAGKLAMSLGPYIFKRINVCGSLIGGLNVTQEMLDFSAKHKIRAMVQTLEMNSENVNVALKTIEQNQARFRMVLVAKGQQ